MDFQADVSNGKGREVGQHLQDRTYRILEILGDSVEKAAIEAKSKRIADPPSREEEADRDDRALMRIAYEKYEKTWDRLLMDEQKGIRSKNLRFSDYLLFIINLCL